MICTALCFFFLMIMKKVMNLSEKTWTFLDFHGDNRRKRNNARCEVRKWKKN